jgi:hypothetical protein
MKQCLSTMFMFALSVTGVSASTCEGHEWNIETKITINQPIEAEGTVLRVGSYVLMLVDLPADRSTVCIFEGSRAPHYRDRIR